MKNAVQMGSSALWSVYDPPPPSCPRSSCARPRKEPLWRLMCLAKGSDKPMGATWWKDPQGNVVLRNVKEGTAADQCGLKECVGWSLSHVNGVPVEDVQFDSLRPLAEVRLRFTPSGIEPIQP